MKPYWWEGDDYLEVVFWMKLLGIGGMPGYTAVMCRDLDRRMKKNLERTKNEKEAGAYK